MENCGIDLISSKKELHFPNGTVVNYKTQTTTRAIKASQTKATTAPGPKVTSRCILLQAPPTSTWLNPGESITLTKPDTPICDGKYLIAPHPEAKGSTQEWITTGTHEIKDGNVTIINNSAIIQKVSAKDHVAQSFAMLDPDIITDTPTAPTKKKTVKEPN